MVYNKGKFVNADLDKASTENERNAVLATTASGREITFVQVVGLVARRILCYTQAGAKLSAANAMALSASVRAWMCICLSMRRRKWRLVIK